MEKIITFIGAFLKHTVGILLLCWRRMLRAGLITFAITFVLALLVAVISTGQAFPGTLAVVAALLFGSAMAYGAAMTVLIEEFLLGVVDLIHLLEGDVEKVAHITATVAEREAGDVTHGLRRLLGIPVPHQPAPPLAPTMPSLPQRRSVAPLVRDAAIAGASALAVGAVARATTPPTPVATPPEQPPSAPLPVDEPPPPSGPVAGPVRADQLPRIGWTLEHEAVRPPKPNAPSGAIAEIAKAAAIEGAGALIASGIGRIVHHPVAPVEAATPQPPDAPEFEDERLTAPTALALPEEPASAPESQSEPASVLPPLDPMMLAHAPPTTPIAPEPPLDPAMLAYAPATTPLAPERQPLDSAMLQHAPATTPLPYGAPQPDPAMLRRAPSTNPLAHEAPPLDPAMLAHAPATTPFAAESQPEPVAHAWWAPEPAPAPEPVEEPQPQEPPRARSGFARITQPVASLDTSFDAITRGAPRTEPRASAPESSLWERLSQALIDRSGAPSSPFAAPQARPAADAGSAPADDAADATQP